MRLNSTHIARIIVLLIYNSVQVYKPSSIYIRKLISGIHREYCFAKQMLNNKLYIVVIK